MVSDPHVGWLENSQSVSSSEHKRTIIQLTRSSVVELIATQSVGFIIIYQLTRLRHILAQSVQCTYPQISLLVFLYTGNICTSCSRQGSYLSRLRRITHQSVTYHSNPYMPIAIFI